MAKHKFWGEVDYFTDYGGFGSKKQFNLPFSQQAIEINLGADFDEDGEEIDTPPNQEQLDDFQLTFLSFMENFETILEEIKQKSFVRYQACYAHYYENKEKSGKEPLNIDSAEKHFEYLKNDIRYIRIWDKKIIQIPFDYQLDSEHGLEIKIQNNQVVEIGGLAELWYDE